VRRVLESEAARCACGKIPVDQLQALHAELKDLDAVKKATDEHDVKLAYSCLAQSRAFGDPTYRWVATEYLRPRLPAT